MDLGRIATTDKGNWMTSPLSSPIQVLPGDSLEVEGSTVWLKRNDHYIDSRTIGVANVFVPVAFSEHHTLDHVIYWRKKPMPAAAVTITNVTVNQASGVIRADFSDGTQNEFADFATLLSAVEDYDTATDHAKNLLLLALIRRSPDGSNLDALNGSSCTIDGQAATPVQFSLTE